MSIGSSSNPMIRPITPAGKHLPKVQLDVALKIVRALMERYPSIQEILGHDDVNLRNRYDPGPLFPMPRFRKALFEREEPEIEEYFINHETEIYSNFQGRLPNTKQKTLHVSLPAKSLVKVIKTEGDFTLVTVIKAKNADFKGTGWIQTASLGIAEELWVEGRQKDKTEGRRPAGDHDYPANVQERRELSDAAH